MKDFFCLKDIVIEIDSRRMKCDESSTQARI